MLRAAYDEELDRLIHCVPLKAEWERPELFLSEFSYGKLRLSGIGLSLETSAFGQVTASAAGVGSGVVSRAYFELLERLAISEMIAQSEAAPDYELEGLRWESGIPARVPASEAFPTRQGATWVLSRSNGVAAQMSFAKAADSAAFELIERDRVLRSWYGEFSPEKTETTADTPWGHLDQIYSVEAYEFGQATAGVFAFPKVPNLPLVFGFGAGKDMRSAVEKAECEALQRLSFLHEEPMPEDFPSLSFNPMYHLDYYLCRKGIPIVIDWLHGKRVSTVGKAVRMPPAPIDYSDVVVANVTPLWLQGRLSIVKAISPSRLPLVFGVGNPNIDLQDPSVDINFLGVHPIA